jgi:NarL family two-component system response regulator LiaR
MNLDTPIAACTTSSFEHAVRQLAMANEPQPSAPKRIRKDRCAGAPACEAANALRDEDEAGPAITSNKVLLVDDHDLVRMGIKALLDSSAPEPIDWVEAATLTDALALYESHGDVALVLLDLNLADCKGLQGLRQMISRHPRARVLILSGTHDEFVVRQAQAMGAAGYLNKAGSPATTRDTLLAMLAAQPAATVQTASPGGFAPLPAGSSYDRVAELGPRHLEILELVLSGCTNQEISASTQLSLGTVKNYVSTILLALDVKSRSHLISLFR